MAQLLEKRPGISVSEEALSAALPLWQEPLPALPQTIPAAQTAVHRWRMARQWRMDWAEMGILLLLVACAALAIHRLAWAMQP